MNEEKTELQEDAVIIQGLREAERFYEATSRVNDIPALIEEIKKRLEHDPSGHTGNNSHTPLP